jgi:hypothetical protein
METSTDPSSSSTEQPNQPEDKSQDKSGRHTVIMAVGFVIALGLLIALNMN